MLPLLTFDQIVCLSVCLSVSLSLSLSLYIYIYIYTYTYTEPIFKNRGQQLCGPDSSTGRLGSLSGRDIFCLKNFDPFTRTSVRVSKMNAVARAHSTFQMLTLLQNITSRHSLITGIYPTASVRRYVLMSRSYNIYIYIYIQAKKQSLYVLSSNLSRP